MNMAFSDDLLHDLGAEDAKPRRKQQRGASARKAQNVQNGALNELVLLVREKPVRSISVCASVLVFALVFFNAAFLQEGKHPAPLFAQISSQSHVGDGAQSAPTPRMREVLLGQRSSSVSNGSAEKPIEGPRGDDLVRRVQTLLALRGYYEDDIDGIPGSRTRAAVIHYQKAVGMTADGEINKNLADHIALSTEDKSYHSQAIAKVIKQESVASVIPQDPKDQVRKVQKALSELGYGALTVDGLIGNQTRHAIRQFELNYGLEITGEVSEGLLSKLAELNQI